MQFGKVRFQMIRPTLASMANSTPRPLVTKTRPYAITAGGSSEPFALIAQRPAKGGRSWNGAKRVRSTL